jgi:glycerophosphoryl diester phosphodiesterase
MEPRIHQAPTIYRSKKRKKFSLKWFSIIITVLVLLYLVLFLLVVPERPDKAFFANGGEPLVLAHRGGASLAPENTLVAFEKARSIGVDAIEFDVRATKDGHLVVIHDETVDRTTNGEGRVDEMNLQEIRQLDAAYSFQDIRGNYIYRGQGFKIPTVEEVFQKFGNMRMNIELKETEMKETEPRETVAEMERKLWELIEQYGMQNKVLVVTFSKDIADRFRHFSQGRVATAAPKAEVTRFVVYHKLFLNRLYKPESDAFQIPTEKSGINLVDQRLINGAHDLNMPVHYWTVDNEQLMVELLQRGADGILTNRPDLLIRVINEMEALDGQN